MVDDAETAFVCQKQQSIAKEVSFIAKAEC